MLIETMFAARGGDLPVCYCRQLNQSYGAKPDVAEFLLIAAGIVTTVPLLCFTAAATRLRLNVRLFPVHWSDADVPAGRDVLW